MMRKNSVLIMLVFVAFGSITQASGQSRAVSSDQDMPQMSSKPPPPGFASRWDYVKSLTNERDILKAYRDGLINKDESILAMSRLGNAASLDTYGKVVDQSGQAIYGVKVQGFVKVGIGDSEEIDTETDAQGQFQFLGAHGQGLGIRLHKNGYEYGYKTPYQRPFDYLADPGNPLVITLWKLHGPEPMVHTSIHEYVPCDGSVICFDLLTGKKSPNGDLGVSVTRNPLNIVRGKPFNWSVTFEITNGGLQSITNLYPNEAPLAGYQSMVTYMFLTNAFQWSSTATPYLYFKSKDGKVFGRMNVEITADYQPPPTVFRADILANPAGSRNLEYDPKKRIKL